ncbi:MAG: hypothetical protein H6738_04715 [Alphaproteobacteria bacterium]|nr:hypothetical protein [Alphaproteobacteria bacterium]MCB9696076.1 hypothetical protein [Alphaproteobacteria bacterium]
MSWNARIRQIHRWTSIVFTLAVLANFVAMAVAPEAVWVGMVTLLPLLFLLVSGLYLFVLPYTLRGRGRAAPPDAAA